MDGKEVAMVLFVGLDPIVRTTLTSRKRSPMEFDRSLVGEWSVIVGPGQKENYDLIVWSLKTLGLGLPLQYHPMTESLRGPKKVRASTGPPGGSWFQWTKFEAWTKFDTNSDYDTAEIKTSIKDKEEPWLENDVEVTTMPGIKLKLLSGSDPWNTVPT